MIGKSASVGGTSVAAAKQIFKKAVFCIDNVGTEYNVEDIRSFVSSLSVAVVSCFQVKPRRRRNEEGAINDRKAFRLCISADDQERLLDANKWPKSIAISEWFHISPRETHSDKRRRLADEEDEVIHRGAIAETADGRRLSVSSETSMEHHGDETIPLDSTLINSSINYGGE